VSLKARWYRDKLAKKIAKGLRGYPVATVAYYGPDATHATKVAVGIIEQEGLQADVLERWYADDGDVRTDPRIVEAVVRFIESHGAKTVVSADRIIGYPARRGGGLPRRREVPAMPVLGKPRSLERRSSIVTVPD
jgi:hypothetical protein